MIHITILLLILLAEGFAEAYIVRRCQNSGVHYHVTSHLLLLLVTASCILYFYLSNDIRVMYLGILALCWHLNRETKEMVKAGETHYGGSDV
jgi:hypothetical protein